MLKNNERKIIFILKTSDSSYYIYCILNFKNKFAC